MQTDARKLIDELINTVENSSAIAMQFRSLSNEQLNYRSAPEKWSILECIEHLNLYGDFYLPEIEKSILGQKDCFAPVFKSGLLGNYFANLMKVTNGKLKKMPAPKDKNPLNRELTVTSIDRFLKQQERMTALLKLARNVDLTKTKTAISLSKFIRLRLGDTFRFVVYHIERHVLQAEKIKQQLS